MVDVVNRRITITRRALLRWALLGSLLLVLLEGVAAFVGFYYPRRSKGFGGKITAGSVDNFPPGSITHVREGKFYISHVGEGFLALYQKCTHLGCVVPWMADQQSEDQLAAMGRFNCPCHASIYDRYGVVKAGPAPRPLDLFPMELVDGKLVVDTNPSRVVVRDRWETSQAVKV